MSSVVEFGVLDSLVSVGEFPSLTVSRGLETDDGWFVRIGQLLLQDGFGEDALIWWSQLDDVSVECSCSCSCSCSFSDGDGSGEVELMLLQALGQRFANFVAKWHCCSTPARSAMDN